MASSLINIDNSVQIYISGYNNEVKYSGLKLSQALGQHHHFEFLWRLDMEYVMDVKKLQDAITNYIGAGLSIAFENSAFQGIITNISLQGEDNAASGLYIQGFSPTILIDDIPVNRAYEESNLQTIFGDLCAEVPGNVLKTNFAPKYASTLQYVVQYNETDFSFLRRVSIRNGEFMFYDGETLQVKDPERNSVATIESGLDLKSFHLKGNIRSNAYHYTAYDEITGESQTSATKFASGSNHSLAQAAAEAGKNNFRSGGTKKAFINHTTEAAHQDQLNELLEKAHNAQLVQLSGRSRNSSLKIGAVVTIKLEGGSSDYLVTSITHLSDTHGQYENIFDAVPADIEVPPYTNPFLFPMGEVQPARVTDNKDPEKLGRVRVKFFWHEEVHSPWIRIAASSGGAEQGMYFIPEIDDEVLVGYEGNNAERPYVIGSMYHGKAKAAGFSNGDNNMKALRTRSGHTIMMDDDGGGGSITISDCNNNSVTMTPDGVTITSDTILNLNAKEINITASEKLNMSGDSEANLKSKQILVDGQSKTTINSSTKTEMGAPSVLVTGKADVKVEGANVDVDGKVMTNVKGTMLNLNCS